MPEYEAGSGNVYEDLGFADPQSMLVKAQLAASLTAAIKRSGLTQTEAAKMLGISQPKLSGILAGKFAGVSERKLMDCLVALNNDVEISIQPRTRRCGSNRGVIRVISGIK